MPDLVLFLLCCQSVLQNWTFARSIISLVFVFFYQSIVLAISDLGRLKLFSQIRKFDISVILLLRSLFLLMCVLHRVLCETIDDTGGFWALINER